MSRAHLGGMFTAALATRTRARERAAEMVEALVRPSGGGAGTDR